MNANLFILLPKFLWKHVTVYLTSKNIHKTFKLNNQLHRFSNVEWKEFFLDNTCHSIVVVACKTKIIDNFWLYAVDNYTIYDILIPC